MARQRWILVGLVAVVAGAACSAASSGPPETKVPAITIAEDESTGLKTLTLSEKAAERLGVETVAISETGSELTVPYAAIIYDASGKTWAYVNDPALTYRRAEITVVEIDGDTARISAGPPSGTLVVTTGAVELYGAEIGVGGGH